MNCTICNKRLTRKTARQVDGVVQCSACMFAPRKSGETRRAETGTGSVHEHAVGPEGADAPNPSFQATELSDNILEDQTKPAGDVVGLIAAKLEQWDMKDPPNDFTGHDYRDIAADIIATLTSSTPIASDPDGVPSAPYYGDGVVANLVEVPPTASGEVGQTEVRKPLIMKAHRPADVAALRQLADYIESDTYLKLGNKTSWRDCLEGIRRHYLDEPASPELRGKIGEIIDECVDRATMTIQNVNLLHKRVLTALSTPTPDDAGKIVAAAQAVVKAYPVAAGTILDQDGQDGYGTIRALRLAIERGDWRDTPSDQGWPTGAVGIQYNGGNGDHPFVKVHFDTIANAEAFHERLGSPADPRSPEGDVRDVGPMAGGAV